MARQQAQRTAQLAKSRTLSQTMIRFQKPIILSSIGVAPSQAFESLIATTYVKWRMNSMVSRHAKKRTA